MEFKITNNTSEPVIFPAGIVGIVPDGNMKVSPTPTISEILHLLDPDLSAKDVIFYKGASVGMSSGLTPAVMEYLVNPEPKEL